MTSVHQQIGWIADHFGRVPALIGTNVVGGIAGIFTAYANSFWSFALCRFFAGFAFDNCYTIMYILGMFNGSVIASKSVIHQRRLHSSLVEDFTFFTLKSNILCTFPSAFLKAEGVFFH